MRKGIKRNVQNRVNANRARIVEARDREEREAAGVTRVESTAEEGADKAMRPERVLMKPIPARISGKVLSLDVAYSAHRSSGKQEQKEQGTDAF